MNGGFPDRRGFSWKGKTLLSGIDPARRAERVAESVPVADRTLYVCPSPLYGYGLDRLLARIASFSRSALLCIEAEPELFELSQEHFGETLMHNPQLYLTNRREAGPLCALLRQKWGPRFFRRVETIRLNGGWQLYPELYDYLAESLQWEIALDWGNAMTITKLGRRYIRNALRNLGHVPHGKPLNQVDFGSDPVLVLGAGPSLDRLFDSLCRCNRAFRMPQERPFRIVCVDTCLTALQERGITPDLAVILESQHWNLDDFTGLSGWKIPAAMDLSALPQSAGILTGALHLFFTPWTALSIFGRLNAAGLLPPRMPPLGSVGLTAAAIARRLTRGNIVTAGLDFSYTLDSYHARSTPGHKGRLRRQNRFSGMLNAQAAFGRAVFRADSKAGERVYSTPAMRNYRDVFEQEFGGEGGGRFFGIAGSGLPLGIRTLQPEAAVDLLYSAGIFKTAAESHEKETVNDENSPAGETAILAEELQRFICDEWNRLIRLRDMLTGAAAIDGDVFVTLIDECDYLWAHFPDYAGTDRRPEKAALINRADNATISFLKRLRVEIDPFLKLWKLIGENCMITEL
ncbi:MAG: DUF115 domain-containing protein [Treponema sp.]|nr:DUF115 domain-containing protein [Treponema sp.]